MNALLRTTALGLLGIAAAACSRVREGDPGSCLREGSNVCVEYERSQGAAGKRMCVGMRWIPGEKSCPADKLGTCLRHGTREYYYGGAPNNYSLWGARESCEWAGGVFTPAEGL